MSIEAMSCAWHHSKHTGGELMVLLAVSDNANDELICWPSRRYIAKKCRMSERNVQRCIQELLESGELIRLTMGKGHESSRYKINLSQMRQYVSPEFGGDAHVSSGETPTSPKSSVEPPLFILEAVAELSVDELAELIYKAYPLHVARPKAIEAIKKQIRLAGPKGVVAHAAMILDKTKAFAAITGKDLDFCPNPTTWFNQQRFNDDPTTWKRKNGTHQQSNTASSRTIGTANEGRASQYANAGKV